MCAFPSKIYYGSLYALFFVFFVSTTVKAQEVQAINLPVEMYGESLKFGMAGGLNAPQFSEADLNNDGILDVYIFDRIGHTHLTFLNEGIENATSYTYAPEYALQFPDSLVNFALLRDYDQDGVHDLFTYSVKPGVPGVAVYKGFYNTDNQLAFTLLYDALYHPSNNGTQVNLVVLNIDVPDFSDADCDGDLDILTFDFGGGNINFFRNYSIENGYGMDSLIFELEEDCWGGFYESGFSEVIDLSPAQGECYENITDAPTQRHAGSTILTLDLNGDGVEEVLLGDISFPHIAMLSNGGTCGQAWMNAQDLDYPSYDVPAQMSVFPASFHLDVNNDGRKDLLVAPNATNGIIDTDNVWFYRNSTDNSTPRFELNQRDLFVGDMLDLGTGAQPALVDYDADGLLDLVVGNHTRFVANGDADARLYLFRNVGTLEAPAFQLIDDDWLGFSQYNSTTYNFSPTFGDLDGDGDTDMLVGEQWGSLFYAENIAGAGNPFEFADIQANYQLIDVRNAPRPTLYDYNQDGLMDIVIGERNGILNYFQNYGTIGNPLFYPNLDTLNNSGFLGQVNTRDIGFLTGHSAPVFVNILNQTYLVSGSERGVIKVYGGLSTDPDVAFEQTQLAYGDIFVGKKTALAIANIDADPYYELIIGNERGGLNAYDTEWSPQPVSTNNIASPSLNFEVFPNPARTQCRLAWTVAQSPVSVVVFNQLGQAVFTQNGISSSYFDLPLSKLESGIYFVRVATETGFGVQKLVVE